MSSNICCSYLYLSDLIFSKKTCAVLRYVSPTDTLDEFTEPGGRALGARRQWADAPVETELSAVACNVATVITTATITARPIWNHRGLHPTRAGSGKRRAAAKATLTQTRTIEGRANQAVVTAGSSTRGDRRRGSRAPPHVAARRAALRAARPGRKGSIRWISMRTTATSHLGAAVGRAGRYGCL
jgi:hypothetical protein